MVIWGIVTLCQAFITGLSGFYATRFLLAAGEVSHIALNQRYEPLGGMGMI